MEVVSQYYRSNNPVRQVMDFLDARFASGEGPDVKTLAAVDSFHLRGRAATVSLAGSVGLQPGMGVLDVGAGPGGTARYLADHFGLRVVGLDLTYDFSRLASLLSEKTNMAHATRFTCASALAMPFANDCFDGVWMEHVQMNIPDKACLSAEIYRVLKPTGFLAMYEVFQAGDQAPSYPLPWADDASCSLLAQPETMRDYLTTAGFRIDRWHDCYDDIRGWLEKRAANPSTPGKPLSDVRLLMGDHATQKVQNLIAAVMDKRLRVIEAVCRKR